MKCETKLSFLLLQHIRIRNSLGSTVEIVFGNNIYNYLSVTKNCQTDWLEPIKQKIELQKNEKEIIELIENNN